MDIIIIKHTKSACLAQPVEHAAVNRSVGGSSPSTGAIERNRIAVSFLFLSFSSNPLTLFSPCTTPACRSVGENMLFRRALRSLRGSSPLAGTIVAARRTSQQLSVPRRVVCMYACGSSSRRKNARRSLCSSFLRNYRTAPSFLLRGAASPRFLFSSLFLFIVLLEPPDAVIPHKTYVLRGPRLYPTENAFGGGPGFIPHKTFVLRGPRFMPHRKYFRWGPRFDAVVFGNGGKRVF